MEKKAKKTIHYSPLRYPGGKNCIFPFVSKLFYENELIGMSYAEPYAGGAGLALRLLFEGYVDHVFINDLDKAIYSFWKSILDDTDEFCRWLEDVEISMENWNYYKNIQRNADQATSLDLAKATFFLNRTNVSGVLKGGVIGGFNQTGTYKMDARFNKSDLILRIQKIASSKNRITVSNLDGLSFIKKMNRKKKEVFIYIDPPYVQKGADLYMNFYTKMDHEKLSKAIPRMQKKWMVSYDNHDFILNLYAERRKIVYQLSQATSNRVGDEILIFCDQIDFRDSMTKLKSPIILSA